MIHVKDGNVTVNDAHITASARASNGIVHIIDGVLLPIYFCDRTAIEYERSHLAAD